jgi:hypothetical protein
LKLQSCDLPNENDKDIVHIESPRDDFSDSKSDDDDFSRDDNNGVGADSLMSYFSLDKSLKNDRKVNLKLPISKFNQISIESDLSENA